MDFVDRDMERLVECFFGTLKESARYMDRGVCSLSGDRLVNIVSRQEHRSGPLTSESFLIA